MSTVTPRRAVSLVESAAWREWVCRDGGVSRARLGGGGGRRRRRTVRGRRRQTSCLVDFEMRFKDRRVVLAWRSSRL